MILMIQCSNILAEGKEGDNYISFSLHHCTAVSVAPAWNCISGSFQYFRGQYSPGVHLFDLTFSISIYRMTWPSTGHSNV